MKRFLLPVLILFLIIILLPPVRAEEETDASESVEAGEDARTVPDPSIRFIPEDSLPLPSEKYPMTEKRGFAFGGAIVSEIPLSRVWVTVSDENGQVLLQEEDEPDPEDPAAVSFPLRDATYPFEDESLSARTDFASLRPGNYVFTLKAASEAAGEVLLYTSPFTVTGTNAVHTLIPNDLRGTYLSASAYLGEGALPFTYRTGDYGQIFVDGSWMYQNLVLIDTPFNEQWRVNKAAAESFKEAIRYLQDTYIHVDGKWDSGIIRLNRLIRSYNGPFIGREEENTPFLSPHVLGLAVDLNTSTGLNGPVSDNWDTFCREISENLIYNGIREKNGLRYYDFTYIGNWGTEFSRVPTILQNYLLYELAFYRAGFFWGVYYEHTCDASHFGLGEYDPAVHSDSPLALRKVFEYIDP